MAGAKPAATVAACALLLLATAAACHGLEVGATTGVRAPRRRPSSGPSSIYKNVLARRVLFASDAALLSSPATARMVRANARLPASWEKKFARAMVRMASIELKAAHRGEIRKNCRVVN
uniref:Plant heme peroxidase family profile domain-containing protein n=1 Tax=Oryza glumipatula TaxID=40148 RepID=A0A0E0ANA7_9ORYZ